MASVDQSRKTSKGFRDISLSFSRHPVTSDVAILVDEDAIKRSVMNLVRTKIGERFYNPLLGSRIEDQMFEIAGSDAAMELEDDIVLLLDNFEPRVAGTAVKVVYPLDSNSLIIEIAYDIVGITAPRQNIDFILQSTRI
tara:strand:- start:968 stop:1384 length:417 start_codon:yes stop_codon:yes gene_type:complete